MEHLRRIKFRGLRIDKAGFVFGSLVVNPDNSYIHVVGRNKYTKSYYTTAVQVIPESVGQFTGKYDKNDKGIYEGDMVFNSNKTLLTLPEDPRTYEVVWVEGEYDEENKWLSTKPSFSFRKIQPNNKRYMELIFNQSQIEVIGNIHENK